MDNFNYDEKVAREIKNKTAIIDLVNYFMSTKENVKEYLLNDQEYVDFLESFKDFCIDYHKSLFDDDIKFEFNQNGNILHGTITNQDDEIILENDIDIKNDDILLAERESTFKLIWDYCCVE